MNDHFNESDPQADGDNTVRPVRVLKYADGVAPSTSTELLKALFDRIVADCGISRVKWGKLANAYIMDRAREKGLGAAVNLVEERSSLNKNFVTQDKMSLRSFCRAMQFLRPRRFRLSVTIEHASGRLTEHGLWVTVDANLTNDPELDDDVPIPTEVESLSDTTGGERLHTPPPDLRKFSSQYPSRKPEGSDSDDSGS